MKITLDQERCVGSGQCVLSDPAVFDQREEDGIGVLLDPAPGREHADAARHAEGVCPAAAIRVRE